MMKMKFSQTMKMLDDKDYADEDGERDSEDEYDDDEDDNDEDNE